MPEENSPLNLQGYNIVTILKRLETATSRLEDITIFQDQLRGISTNSADPKSTELAAPITTGGTSKEVEEEQEPEPQSVILFDELVATHVEPFVATSKAIDPLVGEAADHFLKGFKEQSKFLRIVSLATEPSMTDPKFTELLTPITNEIQSISDVKETNRKSKFGNNLNTLAEGAAILGWIVSKTPVPYIGDIKESTQFWLNRIMKEFKEKDVQQVDWVKQLMNIFDQLKDYVKENHKTGPSWNSQGKSLADVDVASLSGTTVSAKEAKIESLGAPALGSQGPPPPPPPPPSNLYKEEAKEEGPGITAVFADLNKGEGITSGLKKVEKSQMTHKNPELRKQKLEPVAPSKPQPPKKPASLSNIKKKPANKQLIDGSKWLIENFTENDVSGPIEIDVEITQSVFIGNCSGITVILKGKANAISISETKKCGFLVDSLVSGIEVIKSHKFGLQIQGTAQMINVDQCDEGNIYLSRESAEVVEVFSSSTVALNVNIPKGDDDSTELAVPEQFKHTIVNGKLVSEVVKHAG